MKKYLLLPAVLFCLNFSNLFSQNDTAKINAHQKIGGYSFNFGGGEVLLQPGGFDVLNQHLHDKQYAEIPVQMLTWNVDLVHAIVQNTIFNCSVNGCFKKNTVNDSSKTTYSSTSINVALGRVVIHTNKIVLYPLVGVDFGSAKLHSHFSGMHIANDISGTNTYRALDASLNMDYIFKGIGDKINWKSSSLKVPFSAVLSLSVGYIYCPVNSYWTDENFDGTVKNTQNVNYPVNVIGALTYSNFSMFYASLKLGLGGFAHR